MDDSPSSDSSKAVGPGAVAQVTERQKPLLDGLDENYYVEIRNPLQYTFKGKVASSRPQQMPVTLIAHKDTPTITRSEEDVRRNYGLDLRNPDHPSNAHIAQIIEIPPGATIRLPGNEAQVILRQLVNVIMSEDDNQKILIGDSFARRQVEETIVVRQGTMSEYFTSQQIDVHKVLNNTQGDSHAADEPSFPGQAGVSGQSGQPNSGGQGDAAADQGKNKPGKH